MTTAREILEKEYGKAKNFLTPRVLSRGLIRHTCPSLKRRGVAMKPVRSLWTYKGVNVYPADRNASGIRWYARLETGDILRADTKDGMRLLITTKKEQKEHTKAINQNTKRSFACTKENTQMSDMLTIAMLAPVCLVFGGLILFGVLAYWSLQ